MKLAVEEFFGSRNTKLGSNFENQKWRLNIFGVMELDCWILIWKRNFEIYNSWNFEYLEILNYNFMDKTGLINFSNFESPY